MEQLTFQYPTWYLLLCVFLGLVFSVGLYYGNNAFRENSTWLNWLLGGLRFLLVTLLSIFLLSPLIRTREKEVRKPIIVVAQDVSESVNAALGTEREDYLQQMQALAGAFGDDFDVREYSFGASVQTGLDTAMGDKVSNITELLQTVNDLYSGENLGAIILASDGIFNKGSNPVYFSSKITAPIFTVALGDTTPKKDLIVKRVFHNRIAYLGDQFNVQIDLTAQNAAGTSTNLNVYKVQGDQLQRLKSQPVQIDRNDYFSTQEVILDADEAGVQRYRVVLNPIDGEAGRSNNTRDIFVDVLDARQKILLLAHSPHPDLTALRQSIETNKNYEVEIAYANNFNGNIPEYDFVILHQLPSRRYDISGVLNAMNKDEIPRFFIAGMQTDFNRLNQLQSLVNIQADGRNTNDVEGRFAPAFTYFNVGDELKGEIPGFPPLTAPFGEFDEGAGAQTLLYQRIRKIDTRYPLLTVGEDNGIRTGLLLAEGIWKWRLFNYLQDENHELFDEMISKVVQYVSLKEDKRKFRVTVNKNIFDENEQVLMDAELYNNSYELINGPDVTIVLKDVEGKEYPYTFNKSGNAYSLNAGTLPVGNYRFEASVVNDGERFQSTGRFSVQPIQLESYETTADHRLLRLLSDKYGGQVVYPGAVNQLESLIRGENTIKPVVYASNKNKSLINLRWLFFILLVLAATEWFLRRYFGAY